MIGFTGNTLNRGEALRRDEAALAALAQHAASRLLPFVELDPLVHDNELGWVPLLERRFRKVSCFWDSTPMVSPISQPWSPPTAACPAAP
ncbi:hypothetical protein [Hankyongella ginsenosidimutans]|uniref:hypothetical protein n=1 Tax=Hankyongella ginsenosidimutans TaxID=1763828 RepID=UPI001FE47B90|nr:hypothetical protein [Hankyongella ginsenosidimutans]